MPLRPCLDCGTPAEGSRCRAHQAQLERNRKPRPTNQIRTTAERQRRTEAVAAHRERYGEWCPGWGPQPGHRVMPPNILTADHPVAVSNGARSTDPLEVLCRICNGAKSDR